MFLKQLTLVAAGAIASCVSGLSVVVSQFKSSDAEKEHFLESLSVTSRSYAHTDNYNLSIMIL